MATFEPESFGRYYLVDKIAVGGMAEVFKAKSFSTGGFEKLLVIKRILENLSTNEEFVDMFIDEAKISVELQHPNIVQIYDFGQLGENYFIAMECVEGKDVKGILRKLAERRKLLPPEFAVYIAHEMAKGLDFAHKKTNLKGEDLGIIHRDISPSNILISYTGEVKVADFGIAKAQISLYNTKDGVLKGKFEYMSPEQARGGDVSPKSDIFAAGIIMHEMLTGRRLFKTDSEIKTLEKVKAVDIPTPSQVNPMVPARLDELVMKALSQDPADRYEDARALQQALFEYMYPSTPDITRESLKHFMAELFSDEIATELDSLDENSKIAQAMYESEPEIDLDEDWQAGRSVGTQTLVQDNKAPVVIILAMALLLLGAMGVLAWQLTKDPVKEIVETQVAPTHATLQVKVEPTGTAAVFTLDGAKVGEGDTLLLTELEPNPGSVFRVEAEGFEAYEGTIELVAGERIRERVQLVAIEADVEVRPALDNQQATGTPREPQTTTPTTEQDSDVGTARFTSTPPGAQVYVDGSMIGRTPTTFRRGTAGQQLSIEFKLNGYSSAAFDITYPEDGDSQTYKRTLKEKASTPGKVSVNVKTGWAEVWIDGTKIDTTPLFGHELSPGSHTIRVTNPQTGLDETQTVKITSGETKLINF